MRRIAPFVLLLAAVAVLLTRGRDHPRPTTFGRAQVLRVVDGDTIRVRLDGRTERVRYIGVDTPETVKPNAPVECFGPAAHDLNARLLGGAGTALTLRFDRELRDRYGRLLAYVHRDGLFVNARLVGAGAARTLPIAPNTAHAAQLGALQAQARAAGAGLWGRC
jgi:micrococcal nuclease